MDPMLVKTLHLAGAFGFFASIGAVCLASGSSKKAAAIFHGVSLLVILLFGLHLLFAQKLTGSGSWWHVKFALWLVLGILPALVKRKVLPQLAVLAIAITCGVIAAYLGLAKPF
jgi:hypothetical protein